MNFVTKSVFLCTVATLVGATVASARPLDVYLNAPATNSTVYTTGAKVETFEGFATGTYNTSLISTALGGSYGAFDPNNNYRIQIDDVYGSGSGKYSTFGAQTGTTGAISLKLNETYKYFGFSWSAGDSNNMITFLNAGTVVGSYSTATTLSILGGSTVTSIGGTNYNTSSYFGKPFGTGAGQNTAEPYAFINFIFSGTDSFDQIVFSNMSTATGFESDNHTLLKDAPCSGNGCDPTFVDVTDTPAVPEPAPVALAVILGGGIVGQILRVRAKNKKNAA